MESSNTYNQTSSDNLHQDNPFSSLIAAADSQERMMVPGKKENSNDCHNGGSSRSNSCSTQNISSGSSNQGFSIPARQYKQHTTSSITPPKRPQQTNQCSGAVSISSNNGSSSTISTVNGSICMTADGRHPHNNPVPRNNNNATVTTTPNLNDLLRVFNLACMPPSNNNINEGLLQGFGISPEVMRALTGPQPLPMGGIPQNNTRNTSLNNRGTAPMTASSSIPPASAIPPFMNIPGVGGGMNNAFELLKGLGLGHLSQQLSQSAPPPTGTTNGIPSITQPPSSQPVAAATIASTPSYNSSNGIKNSVLASASTTAMKEDSSSKETATAVTSSSTDAAAASTGSGANKEDYSSSLPKTIILPCRARGMPLDHNFRSAHFVIPHNVRHGEDLVCSYEQCRNAGNKFRYCAECRIPVAKRNFHQRHGHGLVCVTTTEPKPPRSSTAASGPSSSTGGTAESKAAKKTAAATFKTNKTYSTKSGGTPTATKRKNTESSTDSNSSSEPVQMQKRRKKDSSARAASNSDTGPLYPEMENIPLSRQLRWATLLGKRPDPDDADGMSAWLLAVMTVSDLKTPLGNFTSSSLTNSGSGGFGSNSDSPEMGSSVNSSLSTDLLTSDVSSEEAIQDSHKAAKAVSKSRKSEKDRRKNSKKDAGKAVRLQEKKRKAQRNEKERRKGKDCRSMKNKVKSSNELPMDRFGEMKAPAKRLKQEDEALMKQQEDLSNDSPDNEELSASYAEWQERKKQKALNHKAQVGHDAALAAGTAATESVEPSKAA